MTGDFCSLKSNGSDISDPSLVWKAKTAAVSLSSKGSYSKTSEGKLGQCCQIVKAALVSRSEQINICH